MDEKYTLLLLLQMIKQARITIFIIGINILLRPIASRTLTSEVHNYI